jgi:ADP-ribose pyrophosphatase YjhB (NUDIX family)
MNKYQHSNDFPDSFYRVSVKGLCVKDDKIFLMKEAESLTGQWELPGGGLDFHEEPREGVKREIEEETKLKVVSMSEKPVYIWTNYIESERGMDWYYTLVLAYHVELEHYNYTPTEECVEAGFFEKNELQDLDLFKQSQKLRELFNPADFQ